MKRIKAVVFGVAVAIGGVSVSNIARAEPCSKAVEQFKALQEGVEGIQARLDFLDALQKQGCSEHANLLGRALSELLFKAFQAGKINAEQAQLTRLSSYSDDPELLLQAADQLRLQGNFEGTVRVAEQGLRVVDQPSTRSIGEASELSQRLVKLANTARNLSPEFISRNYRSLGDSLDQQSPIEFDLNKTTFTNKGEQAAKELFDTFRNAEKPSQVLLLKGHTDITASAAYNCKLSQDRAEAVRDYLRKQGLQARIQIQSLGESESPLSADDEGYSDAQRDQLARRVEAYWIHPDDIAEQECETVERNAR